MEREEIRNHLMDLVDGTLAPERAREVEEALAHHPDLEQEVRDLREAVHLAGQLSGVEAPPDLTEGIRRAVDAARKPVFSPVRILWPVAAAAAAVLLFAVALTFRDREPDSIPPTDRVASKKSETDAYRGDFKEAKIEAENIAEKAAKYDRKLAITEATKGKKGKVEELEFKKEKEKGKGIQPEEAEVQDHLNRRLRKAGDTTPPRPSPAVADKSPESGSGSRDAADEKRAMKALKEQKKPAGRVEKQAKDRPRRVRTGYLPKKPKDASAYSRQVSPRLVEARLEVDPRGLAPVREALIRFVLDSGIEAAAIPASQIQRFLGRPRAAVGQGRPFPTARIRLDLTDPEAKRLTALLKGHGKFSRAPLETRKWGKDFIKGKKGTAGGFLDDGLTREERLAREPAPPSRPSRVARGAARSKKPGAETEDAPVPAGGAAGREGRPPAPESKDQEITRPGKKELRSGKDAPDRTEKAGHSRMDRSPPPIRQVWILIIQSK